MFYVCSTRGTSNFDLVVKGQINSLDSLIKRVIRIYPLGPIGINFTPIHPVVAVISVWMEKLTLPLLELRLG